VWQDLQGNFCEIDPASAWSSARPCIIHNGWALLLLSDLSSLTVKLPPVEKKFTTAGGTSAIKHIYKIIENKTFLQPYDAYKWAYLWSLDSFSKSCSSESESGTKYLDTMERSGAVLLGRMETPSSAPAVVLYVPFWGLLLRRVWLETGGKCFLDFVACNAFEDTIN